MNWEDEAKTKLKWDGNLNDELKKLQVLIEKQTNELKKANSWSSDLHLVDEGTVGGTSGKFLLRSKSDKVEDKCLVKVEKKLQDTKEDQEAWKELPIDNINETIFTLKLSPIVKVEISHNILQWIQKNADAFGKAFIIHKGRKYIINVIDLMQKLGDGKVKEYKL